MLRSETEKKARNSSHRRFGISLGQLILIGVALGIVALGVYVPFYFGFGAWQVVVSMGGLILALWLVVFAFRTGTIRARLLVVFVSTVLLTVIIISIASTIANFRSGQEQAIEQLNVTALLKELEINAWTSDLQTSLASFLIQEEALWAMQALLQPTAFRVNYENQMREDFEQMMELTGLFDELFLVDPQGKVVISSDPTQKDKIYDQEAFVQKGLEGPYLQPPFYAQDSDRATIYVAQPVFHPKGELVLGALVGRANMDQLNQILSEEVGIGESGEIYLVSSNHVMLTEARFAGGSIDGTEDHSEAVNTVLEAKTDGGIHIHGLYVDYRDVPVVGAYHWLPELQTVLVAKEDQAEAFRPIFTALTLNVTVAVIATLFAIVAGLLITRSIANPLSALAKTASTIAAGDLNRVAKVKQGDEIGELAQAFNSMTTQLRGLIGSLEQRVVARTQRLETVASLTEYLTGILDFDRLLVELVNRVKRAFDYYHAHVYIIDDDRQNLVMAAGSGEAGLRMKAKGHYIPLNAPTSLVARAARTGEIVTIDNVRAAEDWLPNPLLPDTYSEMAVPILLDGQVVGVLDVQEDRVAGLDEADANLLRTLANQVAVAIRNARLFAEVETALVRARELQRRYVERTWDRSQITRHGAGRVKFSLGESTTLNESTIAKARTQALTQSEPTFISLNDQPDNQRTNQDGHESRGDDDGDAPRYAWVAPIILRDVPIGNLQLHEIDPSRKWTESELALIDAVIDQVTQTAENLRLIDEAQERAGREQLIGQISDKLRSAPDIETLMRTGVEELSRALKATRTFIHFGSQAEVEADHTNALNQPDDDRPVQSDEDPTILAKVNIQNIQAPSNGQEDE